MTACATCGAENPAGKRFCGDCGSPLAAVCPSCGSPVVAGKRFCGDCGAPLPASSPTAQAPTPSPPAPERVAERRLVSVLFADLVGFTTLSEERDAEEVRELLSRYFDTCRRLIALYGGTVEKFIGDAVMAVWGTPVATEDDAERAVRTALDLMAAVSSLGDEVGAPELRARAGVMTGEAAVTLGAEAEGMVAGDLVNTASRVQSVAEPGAVYVGEATRRSSEPAIAYEAAGSFELKGKQGPTPLWKALRVVSGARGSLKSEGLEAPFVGRVRELRQMKDLFHVCAEERKAQLVSVTGIAGIGKSRLAWEFYKYFDGLAQVVYWHRGRCLAYGDGVTYRALADMVRMRCRIAEDEEPAAAIAKLRETLEEHVRDPDERRFVEPRVAQLLGVGEREPPDRQELFAAWRILFERLAARHPTVLVFEDMQWADAALLDFVEYLLEWSRASPLFVVTLARPELADRRPTWGAGLRNFSSLYLEPLSEAAMQELLAGLVPGLPAHLRDRILTRAEGIPLYAVETVRMLLDRGALVQEGAVYRPAGAIDALEVPETLHALLAARLDGLSPGERQIVRDGAVLGKTFTKRALAVLSGLPEDELDALLSALVRKEVLGIQADPRSPERGQYGFLQDLLRHVAYETLSKRERKTRHLAAAVQLAETLGEEEIAEVVAFHLLEAFRVAPEADDAEQIRRRACDALIRAGERAASLAAAAMAQGYFEQASELTGDGRERTALIARAGAMALLAGRPDEARAMLERALAAYEADGDARPAAHVATRLAELDFMEGRPAEAVMRMEPALEALSAGEPDADVAVVAEQLGRFLALSGEYERAAGHLESALALGAALDLPETLAHALTSRGVYLMIRDRLHEARAMHEAAAELALAHDRHAPLVRALGNLAETFDCFDRYGEALEVRERALERCRLFGDKRFEGICLSEQVLGLYRLGRWEEALAHAAEAQQLASSSYTEIGLLALVFVHCARGELDEARAHLGRQGTVGESQDPQAVAAFSACEARVLRAEGRAAEALAAAERGIAVRDLVGTSHWGVKGCFAEALEAAFELDDRSRARALLRTVDGLAPGSRSPFLRAQQARFHARLGGQSAPDGDALFEDAARTLRRIGTPHELASVLLEHAEALEERGCHADAEPLRAEAREAFDRLHAAPWLARAAPPERSPARA